NIHVFDGPANPPRHAPDRESVAMGKATAKSTAMSIQGHALPDVENFTAIVCRPIPPERRMGFDFR
ncbi:hypothetical protein, partial [Stenotrophomonas sp.]|uniref:hypothetical protein n=1 Tax=Stenotrophomonas sp. TaxID=69392 RepID=UPI0028AB71C5